MEKKDTPYLYNTEKNITAFANDSEGTIETDCNSITFINKGVANAVLTISSVQIELKTDHVFSFDNDPDIFETTLIDKIHFTGVGTKNLLMIKSFTKKRPTE